MTQRARARFSRATRFGVVTLAVAVLTLMSGDRPLGQGANSTAVNFDGVNDYITFGAASGAGALGVGNTFTLELMFKWTGGGTTASTGTGGLTAATAAIPLLTKGTGQAETPANLNMNYFLGISGGKLAADFEDTINGANHPVIGTTTITTGVWHHAAATYDGTTWRLYLDGALDTTLSLGSAFTPQVASIQHAGLGTAMTSAPVAAGFFAGAIDEARIWNVVRTPTEIATNKNLEVTTGTGLIGRWGLNEGSGTNAANSVSGRPAGTLTGGPTWVIPDLTPPGVPQDVVAESGNGRVTIAWNQNADTDLAGYNIYRNGSSTPLNGALLTVPIFTDTTVSNGLTYTYVVKAVDLSSNASAQSAEVIGAPYLLGGAAMQFNGTSQYVTFGPATGATGLGATTFTLETWFKRTGAGIPTNTGSGGLPSVIPLITKGMAESEGPPANVNMNYFLGIRSTDGLLVADFEDSATGLNHPVAGTTPIPISTTTWHHAAATYDGDEWRLYLDGNLETTLLVGAFTPESTSIQHAVIGSALNSTGGIGTQTQGFFQGLLDEVRIWNYARSDVEIVQGMNQQIFVGPIGRFGLNEASGAVVGNTAGATVGSAIGTPIWTAGYPFPADTLPPVAPTGLFATPGNTQVALGWTTNGELDLAGYNVYRRTSSTAFGTPLNGATLLTSPAYLDTTVTNGTQYFYVVKAVDVFNNISDQSNEASATPSSNPPPAVNAGPNRTITLSSFAALSGVVTDNGPFSVLWSEVSGPGSVTFASATSASTTATFTHTGSYVLRLTANDGTNSAFGEMTVTVADPVLVGAGDSAPNCVIGNPVTSAEAVATLLDGIPGTVFTLGDNAYENGTAQEFAQCYDPTWGRHKTRTRPVTGNHDYNTPSATGYYDYFNGVGVQTGPAGNRTTGGYYSYNIGNWHVVVLNSECGSGLWNNNGCAAGSAQEQWLRADLAASPTNNIIAMWHRPLYSSSSPDSTHAFVQPLWQALYEYGVDIWLGGHWHNYERLAPMNASGALDTAFGIRSFVIGTGGINLSGAYPNLRTTSEVRNSATHGVMKFTLHDSSYEWEFIPIAGQSFTDSGSGTVHSAPGGNLPPIVLAGIDQTVALGAASLNGSVTDDGPTTVTWSQVSGPGSAIATFGNPNAAATSVGFPVAGVYVLQLTADDGLYVRSDTVTVSVTSASGNLPPVVNAGPDQTITLPASASLTGTMTDDGHQAGNDVTSTWSNQSPATGTVTFGEATNAVTTASFSVAGTYVLRLTATDGDLSGFDELTVTVNPSTPNNAVDFSGTNAYVTFGAAPGLGVTTMTIEAWFRRDGAGATAESGSSGIIATPIVAKGTSESDGSNIDLNYFMGITAAGLLAADFEDNATGANHPVTGTTTIPISSSVWHHAAATYDGTTWRLYYDGVLEATQVVGAFTPRSDSIQHGSIGSALTSTGGPEGFFAGPIDEVRIWNRALSGGEIATNLNQQITSAPNLVARWGLNETSGTAVNDSTANPINGTIIGVATTEWTRTAGAPFNLTPNHAPNMPIPNGPANGATGQSTSPSLSVNVSDSDGDSLDVTFFGRSTTGAAQSDFTIVAVPDTQHYVDDPNRAATFTAQTQWIVSSRPALNTVFVSHLGDITEHIDAQPVEWTRADASMDVLDAAVPPVPYGIAPGNHDMSSAGVSTNYDLFFPVSRMSGYPWYGGYLGQNLFSFTDPINRQNKNQFSLFSAGGMDFVVIHLEYDMPTYAVAWADRVLKAYPNRRAIIATHLFLSDSGSRPSTVLNRTTDGTPAATVWTNLIVPNCNVFMVLNGHYPGEANRTDATPTNSACPGRAVHQLESDYQSRVNGGDGWLRYMTFKPSENKIYVYTYSPTLSAGAGQFETDANSQFVLDFNMQGTPFTEIATNSGVNSGANTQTSWPGRAVNTQYQWYATVSDGNQTVTGPTWTFTTATGGNSAPVAVDDSATTAEDTPVTLTQADLKGNDTDANHANAQLSVTAVTNATNGSVVLNAGGTVTFTPASHFNGTAGFDYTVSDGSLSDAGHVTVTVTPVNDAPVTSNGTLAVTEDTAATGTLVAIDVDNATLGYSVVTGASKGTVTITDTATGAYSYSPNLNATGGDSFTFKANDGTVDSNIATVTVTIGATNDAPVASNGTLAVTEDTPVTGTLVATDGDSATLIYSVVAGASKGTVTITNAATGAYSYTPNLNATGGDSFTFKANDGTADSNVATVTVTIGATNDAPVASNGTLAVTEDTAATGALVTTDVDSATLSYSVVAGASKGAVTITDTATGAYSYTPNPNATGGDSFTFKANDGAVDGNIATVTVTIAGTNDVPVASNGSLALTEDTPANGTLAAADIDGDGLTFAMVMTPAKGTVTITNVATGAYAYTPSLNATGDDSFTFKVHDGTVDSNIAPVAVTIGATNDAPLASNGTLAVAEDTSATGTLVATDVDSATLSYSVVAGASKGTVTITDTATGAYSYTPNLNATGGDSFTFKANDGAADSNIATVTVTIAGTNDVPVANDGPLAVTEDTPATGTLAAADADGDALTFEVVTTPTKGIVTITNATTGAFSYTPSLNATGGDSFTFKVNDGTVDSNIATVTVTISATNDAPVASNGALGVTEDTPATGTLAATDSDSAILSYSVVAGASKGTVTITDTATGAFSYTPNLNATGGDSFTFKANDGSSDSNIATVTVTITGTNDAPVASDGTLAVTEDTATPGTLSATDVDGNGLTFAVVVQPTKGTVTITDATTGAYSYMPAPAATGGDSFTFKVNDGTVDSNIATVTVTITATNDAPVASNGALGVTEDTAATGTLAATDVDNATLSYSVVAGASKGTVTITDTATGAYSYTPNLNATGNDSFTFKANDGTLDSNVATVSLTIGPVNDVPVANDGTLAVTEDTPATGMLAAADADGDALTFAVVTAPTKGIVTITNATTGAFSYTPNLNATGGDSFTFKVNDGTVDSNIATVTVTISTTNDAPVASNGSLGVTEDTPTTGTLAATDGDSATLSYSVVAGALKGTVTITNAATGAFSYTPNLNATGGDSFTFKANDGSSDSNIATVTVTIGATNDAPVASNGTLAVTEDSPASGTLVATDVDSATLSFSVVAGASKGTVTITNAATGAYTYTPNLNATGGDSFTFKAFDGSVDSNIATVTVTISTTNDAPVASNGTLAVTEDTPTTGTLAATDGDSATLSYSVVAGASKGTVTITNAATGAFSYTPNLNATGGDSFTFKANDGSSDSNVATVTVTIAETNDAPVAVDDTTSATEDTPAVLSQAYLKGNDTDVDHTNAQLSVTAVSNPTNATVVLNGDGTVTFTPAANFSGSAGFDYTVSDGTLADTGHVTVNVAAANDAPSATPQALATNEDTPLSITLAGTDPESQSLTFTIVTAPANGTLSGTGAIRTFTPAANYNGPASFTFTVTDGTATSAPATVSITVTPVSDPPVANGQSVATVLGMPVNLTLTASNLDGGAVTFAVLTGPSNGTLSGAAPNLTYTPAPGYFGGDSFTFTASNASTTSAAATVSISVNPLVSFTPLGVGTHFPTTDAADQGGGPGPRAITPPAVQNGDLVVIVAAYRGTATLTLSQTGGQIWTSEANTQANGVTVRMFWTQFNGIWTTNPAVTNTTGTLPLTVYSFAVDMAPGTYPEIDVPFLSGNHTGATVTVPSFSTNTPGALALAGWISLDDNTWSAPTAGWSTPGGQAQWRNTNGTDSSMALAFRNMASAGATGSVVRNQSTLGPDSGVYFRMAFKATALAPPTAPGDPANLQASAAVGQVSLTWQDNATNEFAFQLERCATSGCTNFAPLVGVGPNVTSFNDTTVANSTAYRYRVRAINSLGASQYSNTADITTPTPPFVFRGVGAHFPTVENADQGGGPGPRAITPPASLQPGDLMVIVAAYRGTATLTLTETGGQVWTSETNAQANGQTVRVFWSQFNGFWTANPAVSNTTGTLPITVYGFAFDMAPGLYPVIDVPFVSGSHAGGTVTVPSFNTNTDGALVLTGSISGDNNTWGAPTTGWSTPGGQAQWRNSNGSDSSLALAYRLMGPAGPTGNIARAQSTIGPDNGLYFALAFRGQEIPSDPPADPSDLQASASVGQVALTWLDHATNEAGFNIERCAGVNCTSFAPYAVAGPNATSYNDTNVASTTTYRYQVRAFNLFSPSNYSNIATVETLAPPPAPAVPFTFRSVGTHFPAADNTAGAGPGPRAVTPPATMQAGDLFVIVATYRENTTLSLVNTGGQVWVSEANTQANDLTARVFWTRFNGTWAGTPSVTNTTGTEALTVYSFAAAMSPGMHPEIDVPVVSGSHSGGTVTVPSFTTNTAGTLVLVGWVSDENNTWAAPTAGWSVPGGQQQWRNTHLEDTSIALAYRVFTTAGPTGSIARAQVSETDSGLFFRLAWKQVPD